MADYRKPALTYEAQLDRLLDRGMKVENREDALMALASISYYRLSAYWYPFRVRDSSGRVASKIQAGTKFEEVLQLYEYDRQLRLLVLNAIERIEVAVRTQITYYMSHEYGAFAHVDSRNFHPKFNHAGWLSRLESEAQQSSDQFIRHYRDKYEGFPTVPVWMITEIMSLGSLSRFYRGLANSDKRAVAQHFNIHHRRLQGWLHVLTYVRNICAHHSRLWNRELAIRPERVKEPEWRPPITPNNNRIFYVLLILRYLMRIGGNGGEWVVDANLLLERMTDQPRYQEAMGLPEDWRGHPLWI